MRELSRKTIFGIFLIIMLIVLTAIRINAQKPPWQYTAMEASLAVLTVTDLTTTYIAIENSGGTLQEANPLLKDFTYPQMIAVTSLSYAAFILVNRFLVYPMSKPLAYALIAAQNIVRGYVVGNNICLLMRFRVPIKAIK